MDPNRRICNKNTFQTNKNSSGGGGKGTNETLDLCSVHTVFDFPSSKLRRAALPWDADLPRKTRGAGPGLGAQRASCPSDAF